MSNLRDWTFKELSETLTVFRNGVMRSISTAIVRALPIEVSDRADAWMSPFIGGNDDAADLLAKKYLTDLRRNFAARFMTARMIEQPNISEFFEPHELREGCCSQLSEEEIQAVYRNILEMLNNYHLDWVYFQSQRGNTSILKEYTPDGLAVFVHDLLNM